MKLPREVPEWYACEAEILRAARERYTWPYYLGILKDKLTQSGPFLAAHAIIADLSTQLNDRQTLSTDAASCPVKDIPTASRCDIPDWHNCESEIVRAIKAQYTWRYYFRAFGHYLTHTAPYVQIAATVSDVPGMLERRRYAFFDAVIRNDENPILHLFRRNMGIELLDAPKAAQPQVPVVVVSKPLIAGSDWARLRIGNKYEKESPTSISPITTITEEEITKEELAAIKAATIGPAGTMEVRYVDMHGKYQVRTEDYYYGEDPVHILLGHINEGDGNSAGIYAYASSDNVGLVYFGETITAEEADRILRQREAYSHTPEGVEFCVECLCLSTVYRFSLGPNDRVYDRSGNICFPNKVPQTPVNNSTDIRPGPQLR